MGGEAATSDDDNITTYQDERFKFCLLQRALNVKA